MKIPKSFSEMTNTELKDERDRLSKLETEIEPWSIFTNKEKIELLDRILKERDEYDAISEFHGG